MNQARSALLNALLSYRKKVVKEGLLPWDKTLREDLRSGTPVVQVSTVSWRRIQKSTILVTHFLRTIVEVEVRAAQERIRHRKK